MSNLYFTYHIDIISLTSLFVDFSSNDFCKQHPYTLLLYIFCSFSYSRVFQSQVFIHQLYSTLLLPDHTSTSPAHPFASYFFPYILHPFSIHVLTILGLAIVLFSLSDQLPCSGLASLTASTYYAIVLSDSCRDIWLHITYKVCLRPCILTLMDISHCSDMAEFYDQMLF